MQEDVFAPGSPTGTTHTLTRPCNTFPERSQCQYAFPVCTVLAKKAVHSEPSVSRVRGRDEECLLTFSPRLSFRISRTPCAQSNPEENQRCGQRGLGLSLQIVLRMVCLVSRSAATSVPAIAVVARLTAFQRRVYVSGTMVVVRQKGVKKRRLSATA